jgi:outer membrane protein assembly factor BamA
VYFAAMAKNWVTIEDRPKIINVLIEVAIESLEKEESEEALEEENALEGDDEPECTIMDTEEPVPTFLEAQGYLDAVTRYCDANGVPRECRELAVELSRELQKHRLSDIPFPALTDSKLRFPAILELQCYLTRLISSLVNFRV